MAALVRQAAQVGLDEVWVVEDHFHGGAVSIAATALAAIERIAVSIGALPTLARNAAITALELAGTGRAPPGQVDRRVRARVPAWMRQIGDVARRRLPALVT
ncbi:MAG TPA: hypothetical protein VJ870_05550 [Amycolatopsis sp.]|nr:hypothetical protein [Amycolatopsis sp.]